jgi:hypothetical protein
MHRHRIAIVEIKCERGAFHIGDELNANPKRQSLMRRVTPSVGQ